MAKMPTWAKSMRNVFKLHAAQMTVNPDEIFPPLEVRSCDLNEIFPVERYNQTVRFNRRTSSGQWTLDQLQQEEIDATNRALGIQK